MSRRASTANYQMEYIVTPRRKRRAAAAVTEEIPQSEFKDGRLLKSKTIAVNDLENGDYRLIVNLRQAGSSEVVASANMPLRISGDKSDLPLYFLSDIQAGAARRGGLHARAGSDLAKERCRGVGLFPPGSGSKPGQYVRRPVSGAALL
jgi:hypothetical protein